MYHLLWLFPWDLMDINQTSSEKYIYQYHTSSTNNFSWPKRRLESSKPTTAKTKAWKMDILFKPSDFEKILEQSKIISVCNAWTMSQWISKGWIELEGSPQYLQKLYSICPEINFNFYSGSKGQPTADPCVHVDIRSRNKNVWFRNWKNSSQLFYLQVKKENSEDCSPKVLK